MNGCLVCPDVESFTSLTLSPRGYPGLSTHHQHGLGCEPSRGIDLGARPVGVRTGVIPGETRHVLIDERVIVRINRTRGAFSIVQSTPHPGHFSLP
jgi:hypothetical protein